MKSSQLFAAHLICLLVQCISQATVDQAAAATAEGLELFAMAKAIPRLQNFDADELGGDETPWTTTAPSAYTDLAQAPIWCSFKGVSCGTDSAGLDYRRVNSINLYSCRLEGYLKSLGGLTEMTKFDVGGNKITGNILHSFFRLSKIEYLDLSKNQLTGSIPPITSASLRLVSLTLDNNRLEGLIPESLSMMNGLQSLRLNNNLFAGTLPSALGEIKSLVRLYLDSNRMTGTIPSTLRRLTKLKTLYLNSNLLTGTIPVLDQSSIRSVILSENYLTMGSLVVVPSSTFSSSAVAMDIALQSNCLVFRNPSKPSQNADATHCRGSVASSAMPTRKPTEAPSKSLSKLTDAQQAAAATAEGLELFAMAKAIPRLQNFDADELGGSMSSWTTTAPSAYTDLAQAPIWCSFKGVSCGTDSAGLDYRRVNSINLYSCLLEGYLTSLSSLTEMRTFSIQSNLIFGDIPRSYFNMQSLSYLDLGNNQLTGSIPPITSVNSRLTGLSLSGNGLEGKIPEGLSMMRALTSLSLGENALEGTIPSTLRLLTNLKSLFLDSNLLTGTIPVLNQNSLQHVILSINYLTMGSLKEIPLTTFSPSARTYLHTNCLVYRHPRKPSQNVDATHCRITSELSVQPSKSPIKAHPESPPQSPSPSKSPTHPKSLRPSLSPSKSPTHPKSSRPSKSPTKSASI